MSSKCRYREIYLRQLPETRKWLNECLIYHSVGFKPDLSLNLYPGPMAKNIRSFFGPLSVNEYCICEDCANHWYEK